MTKLSKSSNPVFLYSSEFDSRRAQPPPEALRFSHGFSRRRARNADWWRGAREASYFIRWHMAYNKRRRIIFEQASREKCVSACVWLWKQTKSSLKLCKY